MAVTSIDVAKKAGVSQATVSRALRDKRGTSEATRQRIREVARELGYVPLQSGRSLSTRRSRRIGIIAGELTNPFYPALVDPIIRELTELGYLGVILHDSDVEELDVAPIFDGSFDGVLLTTTALPSALPQEIERRGIPYVMINRESPSARPFSASVPDNRLGAELMAKLLLDLGHEEIAMISGPSTTSTGVERLASFRDTLARHRIALHPDAVRQVPFTIDAGYDAMSGIMENHPTTTAVFCANDVLALGALDAAARIGRFVPKDLTIVGFDDIPLAQLRAFDLTTVAVDLPRLARQATSHLIERIEDAEVAPVRDVHPVSLILRGTHGPPFKR